MLITPLFFSFGPSLVGGPHRVTLGWSRNDELHDVRSLELDFFSHFVVTLGGSLLPAGHSGSFPFLPGGIYLFHHQRTLINLPSQTPAFLFISFYPASPSRRILLDPPPPIIAGPDLVGPDAAFRDFFDRLRRFSRLRRLVPFSRFPIGYYPLDSRTNSTTPPGLVNRLGTPFDDLERIRASG